ncbi:MAG TPA: lactate utilization protein [Bryobacteraceae bacterium]|nr:lactate utilization protein [Bryobacteraceae bacterium]
MNVLYERFRLRAEAVSAEVRRFATRAEAWAFLAGFLREQGVEGAPQPYALCAVKTPLPLAEPIPGVRFDVSRESAATASVGISEMDWGVADTGTLAQDATAVGQRLVSTLPPVHVAFLPTASIVPDLPALFEKAGPGRCGYLALITGPSRTADIERVLTIGVHGPERLIILCVDEAEGAHA